MLFLLVGANVVWCSNNNAVPLHPFFRGTTSTRYTYPPRPKTIIKRHGQGLSSKEDVPTKVSPHSLAPHNFTVNYK
jgi:hypothetical protein